MAQDFFAVQNGNWNDGATWGNTSPGTEGVDWPGDGDIVAVDGFSIDLPRNRSFICDVIYLQYDIANQLDVGGGRGALPTLTITEAIVADNGFPDYISTAPVAQLIDSNIDFTFTGEKKTGFSGEDGILGPWSTSCVFGDVVIDQQGGESVLLETTMVANSSLTVQTGEFIISSTGILADNTTGDISIATGTTLTVNGAINGDGTTSTSFGTVENNGTITIGSNGYMNTDQLTLNAGSVLSILSGTTIGWYHPDASPPSVATIDANSTISYIRSTAQTVSAYEYGNLEVSSGGNVATKTLGSTGTLNVLGNLTVGSSTTFETSANTNAITITGNLNNNGTWSPTQQLTINGNLTNAGSLSPAGEVIFSGTALQTIGGTSAVTFAGGIQLSNTAGVALNAVGISVDGEFDIDPGVTFNPSDQNVTVSGDMRIDGTLQAGTSTGSFIFDGTTAFLSAGTPNFNNITISGTLTAPATLNVAGNFTNNGTFANNGGTMVFNGTTAQSVSGSSTTTFENADIENTAGTITVSSPANLEGIITLADNTAFNANGNLVLVSDENGDATVAAIPAAASFTGNVIYQRYLSDRVTDSLWRNVGFPVTANVTDISGAGLSASGNLYRYDESNTGDVDQGWVAINSGTLEDATGYTLRVRNSEAPATVEATGALNTGDMNLNVTYTVGTGDMNDDGWNLVNNPYASTIDWGAAGWTKTNVNGVCAVWDGESGGYNYLTGSPGDYISSGQSFWAQTNGSSPVLTATQSVKVNNGQALLSVEQPRDHIEIIVSQGTQRDIAYLKFKADATEDFDTKYDAIKLPNAIHNISTLTASDEDLAVNALPASTCDPTIALNLTGAPAGTYTMTFQGIESLTTNYRISLIDRFATDSVAIKPSTTYPFQVTSDPASVGDSRFKLVFRSIEIDKTMTPEYAVNNRCDEVSVTLNDLQDGLSYYLTDSDEYPITEKRVASGGTVAFDIAADQLQATNHFSLHVSGNSACTGEWALADLVQFDHGATPEIDAIEGATVCAGSPEPAILLARGAPAGGSYRWYTSLTAEPMEGETLSMLALTNVTSSASYYVSALNADGCESSRTAVKVTVKDLPAAPGVISATACEPQSVTLTATGGSARFGYRWYASATAADPFPDAYSDTFSTPLLSESKSYFVAVVDTFGCESGRAEVQAVISPLSSPQLTADRAVITAAAEADSYQWYFNDQPIAGATAQSIEATANGGYAVEITRGACRVRSEPYQYRITGYSDESGITTIEVYPIPFTATLDIRLPHDELQSAALHDLSGNLILDGDDLAHHKEKYYFHTKVLKSGVYILSVVSKGGEHRKVKVYKK